MKANKKFVEEEAVSAVIGVILMVAITVAIAATVYVYISGLGGGSETTPSVTLKFVDGSASATAGVYADNAEVFILEHAGGEILTVSDLRIQFYPPDDATETWVTLTAASAELDAAAADLAGDLGVGDEIAILAVVAAPDTVVDGNYHWRIIHTPSDSIIYSDSITKAI